ncbi:MAG TPA: sulfur carrier protein ThiS [Peptococcaceae bacterium]|nr:sulfur carrier protein ThiS [Peptococcaceae bacterium]
MKVNGKDIPLGEKQSLLDFLQSNNYDIRVIAVELNGKVIPKSEYKDVLLKDEDKLEIVSFVGGG